MNDSSRRREGGVSSPENKKMFFREVQHFRQLWVIFLVLFLAGLVTEVRMDGIYIRYFPFHRIFRIMPFDAIRNCGITSYRPFRDYGGWGVRYGAGAKAYIVSGNRGLWLDLYSGTRILLGSQRPEELNQVIDSLMRKK